MSESGKTTIEQLFDLIENQERELIALKQEIQKLQGFDLGNAMMINCFMVVLSARDLVNFDDLSIAIRQMIAEAEKDGTTGIRSHAVEHLKRLSRMTLVGSAASMPPQDPTKAN